MIPEVIENKWTFQRNWTPNWIFYGCYHKDLSDNPRISDISIQFELGKRSNRVIVNVQIYSAEIFLQIRNEDPEKSFKSILHPDGSCYTLVCTEETRSRRETHHVISDTLRTLQKCDPTVNEVIRNFVLSFIFE